MGGSAAKTEEAEMPYYERPDPKVPINARIPRSVREGLEEVARLWTEKAIADGDITKEEAIDLTTVLIRFCRTGIEGAFAEFGGRPEDESGWTQLIKTIRANAKQK